MSCTSSAIPRASVSVVPLSINMAPTTAADDAHGDVQKRETTAEHAVGKPFPDEVHCPSVSGCAARYCSSTSGVGSAVYDSVTSDDHDGGESCCDSVHAACLAAPSVTYSAGVGTCAGAPKIAGAMRRT